MVAVGDSKLQQVSEWLQWVTEVYSRLSSGYLKSLFCMQKSQMRAGKYRD